MVSISIPKLAIWLQFSNRTAVRIKIGSEKTLSSIILFGLETNPPPREKKKSKDEIGFGVRVDDDVLDRQPKKTLL